MASLIRLVYVSGRKKCRRVCCCCFASEAKSEDSDRHTRAKQLPDPRTHVQTYDVTAVKHRRSKAEPSATASSFVSFASNSEHPSELDRKVAIGNLPESQHYVRLDGAEEVASGLRPLSAKQHKTLDVPEEATRL